MALRGCKTSGRIFGYVCAQFIKKKARNYSLEASACKAKNPKKAMVKICGKIGCRISLKVYFVDVQFEKFTENMGAYWEKQGELLCQDTLDIKCRFPR